MLFYLEGFNIFLTLGNMTITFFDFQLHNSAIHWVILLSSHEPTDLAGFLFFFSIASSHITDATLALSRMISHTDWQISSSFFWMYSSVDLLTLSHSQQHYSLYLNKAYLTCIFSITHITALLFLGTLDSVLTWHVGAMLSSKITEKKHTNVKKKKTWQEIHHEKNMCLVWELKREVSVLLFDLSWVYRPQAISIFY